MKMELQIFKNEQFGQIRMVEIEGQPWLVGKDVADILGYAKPLDAISRHVDEDDSVKYGLTDNLGRTQNTIIINESGLYSLILSSKLPQAKEFKRWVTSEVLPSIRRHGAYMTDQVAYNITHNKQALADLLLMAGNQLKEKEAVIKNLEAEKAVLSVENTIMKPKADYFDELVDRNLLTSFRETAKQLKIKERKFIDFLMEKKYIYRDKKGKLQPTANKNDGLFEVKETLNEKTQWSGTQTLITPKGRETFRLLFI